MTPAPKQPGYGYLTPAQSSPDYPQYPQPTAPYNPQPFDINALLRLLGGSKASTTTGSSGLGTGGIGGPIGATPLPLPGKSGNPVGTYNPGFLGMPMPISPQAPLPDISTILPALPPQMPGGSMEDPYSTSTSRDFGFIGGKPPVAPPYNPALMTTADDMRGRSSTGGANIDQFLAALRAIQGRTTAPQAPLVPERTMPIQYDETPLPANVPMSDEQRKRMLEAFMGSAPRMPSPTPVPQAEMGGRSGMGLGGILNALRASRQR